MSHEIIDLSGSPYYDRTVDEVGKGYIAVLARPGFNIQAREFNVAQGLLEDAIRNVGNLIAKDGTIVEGLELTVDLGSSQKNLSVTDGRVYIGGRIWDVPGVEALPFGALGSDVNDLPDTTVDVVLSAQVITELTDRTLKSPASGFSNHSNPGAHRKKITAAIQLNNSSGVTIWKLVKGSPLKLPSSGLFSNLEPILARRTYDESANYLVSGMNMLPDGPDLESFADQEKVKPVSSSYGIGTVTASQSAHPYGPVETNRLVANNGYELFDVSDIGRYLVIDSPTDLAGSYKIVDVLSIAEVELDQTLTTSSNAVHWIVKDAPQNISVIVASGKAYVLGYEVVKPISLSLSVPRALTGRRLNNEPHTLTFGTFDYAFNVQPLKNVISSAGEGLTANSGVYCVVGGAASGIGGYQENGWGISIPCPGHGTTLDELGAPSPNADNLFGFIPQGGSLANVVTIANSTAVWEWHLDPGDVLYPGQFVGGVEFTKWPGSGTGWSVSGNSVVWHGGTYGVDRPSAGQPYKIVAIVTKTFIEGSEFRVRSTESARLYPLPGLTTNGTSDDLFFPMTTYDLSTNNVFSIIVDGTRVDIDFTDSNLEGPDLIPDIGDRTAVPLNNVINVINYVGYVMGKPNIATAHYESVTTGWLVLKSNETGSASSLIVPTDGGNLSLGFPDGYSSIGQETPEDVFSLGAYRMPSLIAGARPASLGNYQLDVDYEFGLYRKDLVILDKDGNVLLLPGDPEVLSKIHPPDGSLNTLSLGSIEVIPQSNDINIINYEILRLTMPELRRLSARVDNLEYNLAVLDLDRNAVDGSGLTPTDLSGVLTDGFIGFSKADVTFNEGGVVYDATIDVKDKQTSLPFDEIEHDLYKAGTGIKVTGTTLYTGHSTLMTLPRAAGNDFDLVVQDKVTEFITLNQFNLYPGQARATLTPSFDDYVPTGSDQPDPTIQGKAVKHRFVQSWIEPRITTDQVETQSNNYSVRSTDTSSSNPVTIDTSDKILESALSYLRPRTIKIIGQGFRANETGIEAKFDGKHVDLTGVSVGGSDPATGTISALSTGSFVATFQIPSGIVRRFVHTVTLKGNMLNSVEALTTYRTWYWKNLFSEDSYSIAARGFLPRKPAGTATYAPLGQSFSLDRDALITGVSLYFGAVPANTSQQPIVVQIRNMVNGFPGPVAYAEKVIYPSEFSVSEYSSVGSAKKLVTFADPVFLSANQDYAIVLLTESTAYRIGIGRIGYRDLSSNTLVSQQPLSVGKIFTSSNTKDWTTIDDADLKFTLHAAQYATSGTLEFNPLNVTTEGVDPGMEPFTQFILLTESTAMTNSSISWSYSVDNGVTYFPVTPFAVTDILQVTDSLTPGPRSAIRIKAALTSTDKFSSPIILKDSAGVITRTLRDTGTYVTQLVNLGTDTYTEVRQTIKVKSNIGGQWTPYFGYVDGNGNTIWVAAEEDVPAHPAIPVEDGFTQYFYKTKAVLPGPDMTSPSRLVGTVRPSITNPTFNTVGDNTFSFEVHYWNALTETVMTVTVSVTLTSGASVNYQTVINEINAAAGAASSGLQVDLSNIASADSARRIVLTHPQTGGNYRNKIVIPTAGGCTSIGFADADFDVGGKIRATPVNVGGTLASQTYYYLITASKGTGESADVPYDIDAIQVTSTDFTAVAGSDAIEFSFEDGFQAPGTTKIRIYCHETGTPSAPPTNNLGSWKLIGEYTVSPAGLVNSGNPVRHLDSSQDVNPGDTTRPGARGFDVEVLDDLSTFRGRIDMAQVIPGRSPEIRDFTNIFVRP